MTVQVTGNTAVFEVRSETGIGSATAELISGALPEKIVIRLHLRGLEKLDFNYAQAVVTASISSHGDYAVRESVRTEGTGAERPIGQESPYWMNVRVVVPAGQSGSALSWPPVLAMPHEPGDQARETAPPVGHFEVEVPDDFLKGGYRAFSLDWIDFYR